MENNLGFNKIKDITSINQGPVTIAAALIILLSLRFIAQDLIAPLLLAVFLTALLHPLFKWFRKRGFSTIVSVILMIITFIITASLLALFLTYSFTVLRNYLPGYVGDFKDSLNQALSGAGFDSTFTNSLASSITPETIIQAITTILGGLSNLFLYLIIVPVLSILILIQIDSIPKQTLSGLLEENKLLQKVEKFAGSVIVYIVGRTKVNLLTGLGFTIALLFLEVDFPFLWGALTVVLSYIPYVGLIIAGAPPTLIAFSQGGVIDAALVIISITVINLLAENVLDPFIQGRGNRIPMAVMVVSLIFWTWLLGPIGAILSAPLTVLLKAIFSDYQETTWIAALMEGDYSKSKDEAEKVGLLNRVFNVFSKEKQQI